MTAICLTAYAASVMAMFGTACVVHKYAAHTPSPSSSANGNKTDSSSVFMDEAGAAFGNDSVEILPGTGES